MLLKNYSTSHESAKLSFQILFLIEHKHSITYRLIHYIFMQELSGDLVVQLWASIDVLMSWATLLTYYNWLCVVCMT